MSETIAIDEIPELSKEFSILDLFCGAGGLSYGLKQAFEDFNIVGAIDYEEIAVKTYNANHSRERTAFNRDLTEYGPKEFHKETGISPNDVDIICGGPPCKGFSNIRPGRSNNERDDRNYLYRFFFDFIEYYKPKVFIMENVPQLLSHTNKEGINIFNSVLQRGKEIGYNQDWQLLNAAHYGVPQVRTRLFLVGTIRKKQIKFPKPKFKLPDDIKLKKREKLLKATGQQPEARTIESIIKDLPTLEPGEEKHSYFCSPDELEVEKDKNYVEYLRSKNQELTQHKASNNTEKMRKRLSFAGTSKEDLPEYIFPTSGYSSTYSRLRRNKPSSTLTTNFTTASSTRCIHPYENRALSLREGARIQSFPDSFTFKGTQSDIRKQIGNAVPPLLGKAVGTTIIDLLN